MHIKKVRESQEEILRILKESSGGSAFRIHMQEQTPERHIINGRNVMLLRVRDGYSFGLKLLDMLFSREELSESIVYASNKSRRPPLNKKKVPKLPINLSLLYIALLHRWTNL